MSNIENNQVEEVKVEGAEAVAEEVAVSAETPSKLKELMDEAGITTLVPLAKVAGIAPQKLYSKKSKKTGTFNYAGIEKLLLKCLPELTIEEVVKRAGTIAKVRNEKKEAKIAKAEERKQKQEEKLKVFNEGDKVEYNTYRVIEGIKEKYVVTGEIVSITPETGVITIIKDADGQEVELQMSTAVKALRHVKVEEPKEETEAEAV